MSKLKISDETGWQISNTKTLMQTKVADIVSSEMLCQRTGRKAEFYRLVFSDWVNIIATTSKNEIVLVKQFRFGSERMEMEIPGGAIEKDEDPVSAGVRELLEETGYAGKNPRIIGSVCPNPAIQNNRCYTVLIEDVECVAEQNMDEMEDIEIMVEPLARMYSLIEQGLVDHGLVLNAFMFFDRQRKE